MELLKFDLEKEACSENSSDVSSQVASNISVQEPLWYPSKNILSDSSQLSDMATQLSSEHLLLDLSLNFKASTDESACQESKGFSISTTSESSNEPAKFHHAYMAEPIYMEDDPELLWPGSFSQAADPGNSPQNFILTGSSSLDFVEVNPPLEEYHFIPDLTLRL